MRQATIAMMAITKFHEPRRMAAVYTILARLLYKNIVLQVTNNYNTKHMINNKK